MPTVRTREQILDQYPELMHGNFSPEMVEHIVRGEIDSDRAFAAAGDPPACPTWCCYPAGHEYDSRDDGLAAIRIHVSTEDGPACIAQEEQNLAGVVTLKPIRINLYEVEYQEINSARTREIAAVLLAVADQCGSRKLRNQLNAGMTAFLTPNEARVLADRLREQAEFADGVAMGGLG